MEDQNAERMVVARQCEEESDDDNGPFGENYRLAYNRNV